MGEKILSYTAKDVCLSTGFARKRVNFPMDIFGTARGNRESQTLDAESSMRFSKKTSTQGRETCK